MFKQHAQARQRIEPSLRHCGIDKWNSWFCRYCISLHLYLMERPFIRVFLLHYEYVPIKNHGIWNFSPHCSVIIHWSSITRINIKLAFQIIFACKKSRAIRHFSWHRYPRPVLQHVVVTGWNRTMKMHNQICYTCYQIQCSTFSQFIMSSRGIVLYQRQHG